MFFFLSHIVWLLIMPMINFKTIILLSLRRGFQRQSRFRAIIINSLKTFSLTILLSTRPIFLTVTFFRIIAFLRMKIDICRIILMHLLIAIVNSHVIRQWILQLFIVNKRIVDVVIDIGFGPFFLFIHRE